MLFMLNHKANYYLHSWHKVKEIRETNGVNLPHLEMCNSDLQATTSKNNIITLVFYIYYSSSLKTFLSGAISCSVP